MTAILLDGTDIYRARQLVAERLAQLGGRLPSGAGVPRMNPLTSSAGMVLAVGLTSTTRTLMEIRTFADAVLVPRLLGVPGVAKVSVFGGDARQLQIQVDPESLRRFGLALDDIVAAARNATGKRGAGFVEDDNQRITLRTEGALLTADQLGEVVLTHHGGRSLRLRDVAVVTDGAKPPIGAASIMGTTGVQLVVSSQLGTNTVEVTERVERALNETKATLAAQKITLHEGLFHPANFIATAIRNVRCALLLGGTLVAVVLFLFLANVRTAAISFTAIPLSLLSAVIVLDRLGITLNTLTLGGLAIAIGEVVDDAIIDVENILRRIRENAASAAPKPFFRVVLDASIEVRSAVVYATFVVALVFMPAPAMGGVQGKLFTPLGLAYIFAILASLAVALTVTPAMALALFHRRLPTHAEPTYIVRLKARYRNRLAKLMGRPRTLITLVAILCLLALATLPFFGGAFVPVSALADVYMDTGRYMITHEGARRRQGVTCNVRGRDVDSFVAEARSKVTAALLRTVYAQCTGVAEAKAAAQREILSIHCWPERASSCFCRSRFTTGAILRWCSPIFRSRWWGASWRFSSPAVG